MHCQQLPSAGACALPLLRQSALWADTCSCSCCRQELPVRATSQLARPAFNTPITAGEHFSLMKQSQHGMQAVCMVKQLGKAKRRKSNLQSSRWRVLLCLLVKGKGALLQLLCFLQQLPFPFGHVGRPHSWRSSSLRPTAVTAPANIFLFIPPAPPQLQGQAQSIH